MFKCTRCDNEYEDIASIARHFSISHQLNSKIWYLETNNLIEPTCKCGCGSSVKFLSAGRGFIEYVWGHAAKVPGKNNWGNNPKALDKSHTTVKSMIESGEYKPFLIKETGKYWMEGLTKETDERLMQLSNSITNNEEEIKRRSELMREGKLSGRIPSLKGKDSSRWAGGISSLNGYCRMSTKLYKEWKYPKLIKAGFKCEECESTDKLEVHHDGETYSEIIRKISKKYDWETIYLATPKEDLEINEEILELKDLIAEKITDYHIENNVSGIVLCNLCHDKRHGKL